jgi:uracil-DNA glycosylase
LKNTPDDDHAQELPALPPEKTSTLARALLQSLESLAAQGIDVVPVSPETASGVEDKAPDVAELATLAHLESTPRTSESFSTSSTRATLETLAREVASCTRCPLHRTRQHPVFGEGPSRPRLLFVGEGPGADEDRSGRPFVGPAGKLLDRIIQAATLRREDVYIANIVKCRPPDNRVPDPSETATCLPFLKEQIRLLDPKVICTLGAPATRAVLQTDSGINQLRGKRYHYPENPRIVVIPTFHPAYLLRHPEEKRKTWIDIQMVMHDLGLKLHN